MAVAQLVGDQRLELGLVGGDHRLVEIVDGLGDCRLVGGFGAGDRGQGRKRQRAGGGQVTTSDTHELHSLGRLFLGVVAGDATRPAAQPTPA